MGVTRVSRFILQTPSGGTTGQVLTRDTAAPEGMKWDDPTGGSGTLPSQTGNSGKFLTTDGTNASWDAVPEEIPTQTGNSGKFLTTNGTVTSWAAPTVNVEAAFACHLRLNSSSNTATSVRLIPFKGNCVLIGGVPRQLPAAGTTYTISGSPSNGLYYVYAEWDGTQIVLGISRTSSTTVEKTTYGYYNITSQQRSIVGAAYIHSNTFQWPTTLTFNNPDASRYSWGSAGGPQLNGTHQGNLSHVLSLYNSHAHEYNYHTYSNASPVTNIMGAADSIVHTTPDKRIYLVTPVIGFAEHTIFQHMVYFSAQTNANWSITGTGEVRFWGNFYLLPDTALSSPVTFGSTDLFPGRAYNSIDICTLRNGTPFLGCLNSQTWNDMVPDTVGSTAISGARVFIHVFELENLNATTTIGANIWPGVKIRVAQ